MIAPRHPRLSPMQHQQIAAAIRAGGFAHIAAEAFGLPPDQLEALLKRGSIWRSRGLVRLFAAEVRQALAQARLRAEMNVFAAEPKLWLAHGPGRERPDNPGWSVAVKPVAGEAARSNALLDPEFRERMAKFVDDLREFPETYNHFMKATQELFKAA